MGSSILSWKEAHCSKSTVNVGEYIKKHPPSQYIRYLNESKFKQFQIEMGNIVWGSTRGLIISVEDLKEGKLSE